MLQNVKLTVLRRRASAGLAATADLIWPPSCPLCKEQPPASQGVAAGFCVSCSAALSASEPLTRTSCLRCGAPQGHNWELIEHSTQQNSAAIRNPRRKAELTLKSCETHQGDEPSEVKLDASCDPSTFKAFKGSEGVAKCPHCYNKKFRFEAIFSLWLYQARVREAVVAAKQAQRTALNATLGRHLGARVLELQGVSSKFDFVTFVPSHVIRQFARGGNGNQVLAEEVGKTLGVPCRQPLKITRKISKQAWLGDEARNRNVSGAFSLKKSYAWGGRSGVKAKRILLVDDVMTTGATANEVSRVLLASGAKTVCLAVVARAIRS